MRPSLSFRLLAPVAAVALLGCSSLETRVTRPEDQPTRMQLRVEVPESGSSSSSVAPSANIVIEDDQGETLTINRVRVVLNQVEFRRDSASGCVDSGDASEDDGDPCAELAVQPSVLELPIDSDPFLSTPLVVEPGTYEALEFDLQVASAGDVSQQHLDLVGGSVFVQGSYSGSALSGALFPVEGEIHLELSNPIELEQGFSSGMTLTVDVASWFRDPDTGNLIDPSVAAQDSALRAGVTRRILDSFSIEAGV